MTPDLAISIGKDAIFTLLTTAAPILAIGFVVGLTVSLIQAVMQLHEITIVFVPKMVAIGFALVFFASWMLARLSTFTVTLFNSIPGMVSQ